VNDEPGLRVYQVTFKAKLVILGAPADWRVDLYILVGEDEGLDGAVAKARVRLPAAVRWKFEKAVWVAKTVPVDEDEVEGELLGGETYGDGV
jgi:hypothetical protein